MNALWAIDGLFFHQIASHDPVEKFDAALREIPQPAYVSMYQWNPRSVSHPSAAGTSHFHHLGRSRETIAAIAGADAISATVSLANTNTSAISATTNHRS